MESKSLNFLVSCALALLISPISYKNVEADDLMPSYQCSKPGNFSHPDKCSAFVSCDESLTAFQIDCPPCNSLDERCPDGYLHYNSILEKCDWADVAGCGPRPTTTPVPVPDPSECDLQCWQEGDCDCYKTCVPDSSSTTGGRWKDGRCEEGLYWNPNSTTHGGSCDFWENLDPEITEKYRDDELCITPKLECKWEADPKCDNMYFYWPPDSKNDGDKEHIRCPISPAGDHLYWDQDTLKCVKTCRNSPNCLDC